VAFSDAVTVATRLTQGCAPLGAPRRITGAQHNIVLELDDRPALDVLREEAGIGDDAALSRMGGRLFVGLSAGGGDLADYVVRNLIGIDPGNRLIAVGDLVGKGQQLRFFRRDRESARADMGRMLDSIREGLYTKPRGALYFSCLGRGGALFGGESEELKMIEAALGDVPLAGSVLVMQPDHPFADDRFGHVMYVERVDSSGGVWITDNFHHEPVLLSTLTNVTTGPDITYMYFPWQTQG